MYENDSKIPEEMTLGKKKKNLHIKGTLRDISWHGKHQGSNVGSWSKLTEKYDNLGLEKMLAPFHQLYYSKKTSIRIQTTSDEI